MVATDILWNSRSSRVADRAATTVFARRRFKARASHGREERTRWGDVLHRLRQVATPTQVDRKRNPIMARVM